MRRKRYVSFLLALIMILSQASFVLANELNFLVEKDEEDFVNIKTYNEFIQKTSNSYRDDEKIEVVVTLNEDKDKLLSDMKNDYTQKKVSPYTKTATINYYEAERRAKLYSPQMVLNPSDEHGVEATVKYNLATQNLFQFALENKGFDFEIINHIDYIFNAIGISTNYKTAKEIAKLPYVESVDPVVTYKRVEPLQTEMYSSTGMIKSSDLNKTGYTGKGTVAAVLDTGFWYEDDNKIKPEFDDKNLKEENLKLKRDEAEQIIIEINKIKKSNARYINNKIPFAKDYFTKFDSDIRDHTNDRTSHGTHVAGTVVANGNPNNGEIRGVAPEAQILMMQVFNNVAGATGSAFLAEAINDAVKLKADTINMSLALGTLGNTRSLSEKVLGNAINKANQAGVIVAVAAGNYGSAAYPNLKVRSDNFDYGTLRDVSAYENSFAVASFNNAELHTNYLKIVDNGRIIPAYLTDNFSMAAVTNKFNRDAEEELEIIDAGIGEDSDFQQLIDRGVNFTGKAVIMRRQKGTTYETKVGNAKKHGALLAIIYNNVGDELQSMAVGEYNTTMPSLFIGKTDGEEILKSKSKVILGKDSIVIENPNIGKMSDFSSWGASIDLGFKPEITAPGEGIYSTNTGFPDEYVTMSGTSMASPHIAGSSLIIKQYLNENAKDLLEKNDISTLLKNIMMSTAKPVLEPLSKTEYSPRKQGAGLVDLEAATSTKVYAYEKTTGVSKVNLKELEDNESFDIILNNFGQNTVKYDVFLVLNTDNVDGNYITLTPKRISEEKLGSIVVRPQSIEEQKVTVKISEQVQRDLIQQMPNGFWVEGFVYFKSVDNKNADLSIPFISLKTKDNLSGSSVGVIEPLIYDLDLESNDKNMFYDQDKNDEVGRYLSYSPLENYKTIGLEVGGTLENLKARKDKIAISPNGDGIMDNISPKFVLNRYVSRVFFGLEKNDKILKEISALSGYKLDSYHNMFNGNNSLFLYLDEGIKDGIYDLVTTAITNYSEAGVRDKSTDYQDNEKYVLKDKLIVDRNKPRVTKVEVKENHAIITFTDRYLEFEGSGVKFIEIKDKNAEENEVIAIKDDQNTVIVEFPEGKNASNTEIKIEDWAGNKLEGTVKELENKVGLKSINVVPLITNSTFYAKDFSYTITNKETNQIVKADELNPGTYIVKITKLADNLELIDKTEKEVMLKEDDITQTVFFNIFNPEDADRNKKDSVTISYLRGLNGSEVYDVNKIKITATNNIGEKFEFNKNRFNPLEFEKVLSMGKIYNFEIEIEDDNYVAVPSKFSTKITSIDKVRTFQIYPKNSNTETVDINVNYEFEESSQVNFDDKFPQLLINNKAPKNNDSPITGTRLQISSTNKGVFYNLPKYDTNGKKIKYDIQPEYSRRFWFNPENGWYGIPSKYWEFDKVECTNDYDFSIKYKLSEKARSEGKEGKREPKVDISITSNWLGDGIDIENLPDIYFQLVDGNKKIGDAKKLAKGEKTVIWKNQPKEKDRREIYYEVIQVNEDGSLWEHPNFERGKVTNAGGDLEYKDYRFNFVVTNKYIQPINVKLEIDENIKNGKVNISPIHEDKTFESGTEITLDAEAEKGYLLEEYVITGDDGYPVKNIGNKFIMPRVNVTVGAKFKKIKDNISILETKLENEKNSDKKTDDSKDFEPILLLENNNIINYISQEKNTSESNITKNALKANIFNDIKGHWASEAIEYTFNKGYFKGISETEFGPEMSIKRADFVTVLGRIQNVDVEKYKDNKFNDLEEGAYYTAYVNWAVENNIVNGFDNGKFEPNFNLTREQMALIISNYLKFIDKYPDKKSNIIFNDELEISDWAKEAVKDMTQAEILNGLPEGIFSPKTSLTRAQVAQVLFNIYK